MSSSPALSPHPSTCCPLRALLHCSLPLQVLAKTDLVADPSAYEPPKSRLFRVKSEVHHKLAGTQSALASRTHLFLKVLLSLGLPSLKVVSASPYPTDTWSRTCDFCLIPSYDETYSRTFLLCFSFTLYSLFHIRASICLSWLCRDPCQSPDTLSEDMKRPWPALVVKNHCI